MERDGKRVRSAGPFGPDEPGRFPVPSWHMDGDPLFDRGEGECPSCTAYVLFDFDGEIKCRADQLVINPNDPVNISVSPTI